MILNIDLNSVTYTCGWTGFHCACQNGQLEIAEFLMENSNNFDIDVTGFILLETSVIAKNSTYIAISVEGHSITTWTKFNHLLTHPPAWTVFKP